MKDAQQQLHVRPYPEPDQHYGTLAQLWPAYDCSGATSFVLYAAGEEKQRAFGRVVSVFGVTYVEMDFTRQNLLERLAGVAMFLPETAVFELFDQVAVHTSPRTSILFDYAFEDVLTHPERYYGGRQWLPYVTGLGEEPRSGIPAGHLEAVLADHGLRLDSHLHAHELQARYLRRADGTSVAAPFGFCAIAHAFAAS